jgi:hypothetical protein
MLFLIIRDLWSIGRSLCAIRRRRRRAGQPQAQPAITLIRPDGRTIELD